VGADLNSALDPIACGKMTAREPWTCPTCRCIVSKPYCPTCGETRLDLHDLTLRGFIGQVVEALSNIDARLIRSFRCLVTRPGDLTVAYLKGQRKPYILPLPIFLAANLAFFGVQSQTNANIFSTPLDGHFMVRCGAPLHNNW
jgi:hypothetical protein